MCRLSKKIVIFSAVLIMMTCFSGMQVMATAELDIKAPSAVLIEEKSGNILYSKNENDVRPCASITKVMTLLLTMEALENGKISLEQTLSASEHAASMGGSDIWLKAGEEMTVNDLIKATCVASANDAAVVLAEAISGSEDAFVEKMNERASELEMKNTVFKNCNGLDEDGHVTSAYDVAIMSKELIKHKKIFEYTGIWIDYLREGKTQLVNTNKLLKTYSGITGLKTGTTSKAGSCISATAERNDISLIAVVLGCKTTTERFTDAKNLLDYGFSNYCVYTPSIDNEIKESISVNGGISDKVNIIYEQAEKIVINKEDKNNVKMQVNLPESVEAPIAQGQKLGSIEFKLNNTTIDEISIVASEAVDRINFSSIIGLMLDTLFKA